MVDERIAQRVQCDWENIIKIIIITSDGHNDELLIHQFKIMNCG